MQPHVKSVGSVHSDPGAKQPAAGGGGRISTEDSECCTTGKRGDCDMPNGLRPARIAITTGSREGGAVREALVVARRPFYAAFWRLRARWLLHRGVIRARRWHNPVLTTIWVTIAWVLALLLAAWGIRGVITVLAFRQSGWQWGPYNPDAGCRSVGTSCGAINGIVMPIFVLGFSTIVFLAWRLWRVRRYVTRLARTQPAHLVQTAGSLMGEVVGRDQVCDAIMNNLRDRTVRRPHVIIGNVGVGKTALMVHLTERLAARGAIPVPIRLRDVNEEKKLDFCALARERFGEIVAPVVRSDAEQDRLWRWLRRRADRVVILADGLEEALTGDTMVDVRDNVIRKAIAKAGEEKVPLVIASRPHDPLRAMQAAISDLEPLSDEAALHYVAHAGSWRADPKLLDRLVEAANMIESPLYLQVAKDLHELDLLEPLWNEGGTEDPALQDRWALRESLLHAWIEALIDGRIHPELPIDRDIRRAVVEFVSALACIGLAEDSASVHLCKLDPDLSAAGGHDEHDHRPVNGTWSDRVARHLGVHMKDLQRPVAGHPDGSGRGPWMDVRLAATWGTRMGLVHEGSDEVRFQHSIMQAYLGSRYLDAQLHDLLPAGTRVRRVEVGISVHEYFAAGPGAASAAGAQPGPDRPPAARQPGETLTEAWKQGSAHLAQALQRGGRELLIALTLYSRSLDGRCTCADGNRDPVDPCPVMLTNELLIDTAKDLLDQAAEAEDRLYRVPGAPPPRKKLRDARGSLRRRALECYGAAIDIASADDNPGIGELMRGLRSLWEKFGIGEDVTRLGEAKLNVIRQCGAAARHASERGQQELAYRELHDIGCVEPDIRVRAAVARELGVGKKAVFDALAGTFRETVKVIQDDVAEGQGDAASALTDGRPAAGDAAADGHIPGLAERHRLALRQRELRDSQRTEHKQAECEALEEQRRWQKLALNAWCLPMLVESAELTYQARSPQHELERLVGQIRRREPDGFSRAGAVAGQFDPGRSEALSTALALGFKYAANRRPGPQSNMKGREFLIKQAEELLKHSTFWLTRLTLVQALALWALPDDVSTPQPMRGHGADPRGQVRQWLARTGGASEHPLVRAAGRLAVRTLQTRRPERFLWIDEAEVATEIGTEVGSPGQQRFHDLWIPPSTGWSSLDPQAQQLLADVLVLEVLGERGYRPKELFRVLDRVRDESKLPSCLSKDRSRLDPVRAVESATQPGEYCRDDCGLGMCPYPAKAEKHLRLEFTEVFCLRQRDLLKAWQPRSWLYLRLRREAPWQRAVPVAGMRRFWDEMGERARDVNPETTRSARGLIRI